MSETPKERIRHICTELGEDLDSPGCKALREYIKSCPNCAAFVDSVKKTISLYRNYGPEYKDEIHQNLFKRLNLE